MSSDSVMLLKKMKLLYLLTEEAFMITLSLRHLRFSGKVLNFSEQLF